MSRIFYLFFIQVLDKSDLDVLNFRLFTDLAILESFFTWCFKKFLNGRSWKAFIGDYVIASVYHLLSQIGNLCDIECIEFWSSTFSSA